MTTLGRGQRRSLTAWATAASYWASIGSTTPRASRSGSPHFAICSYFDPDLHRKITLVQVVVPSREDIPKYRELKAQIQRMVSELNGHFGEPELGTGPMTFIVRWIGRSCWPTTGLPTSPWVTPLKDGMNLVSKEYCAARVNNDGVLILSEFAGAAFQLHQGALLVNPYHTRAVAEAISRACEMPLPEQRKRMRRLRARIRRENIFRWRDSFCRCGEAIVPFFPIEGVQSARDGLSTGRATA